MKKILLYLLMLFCVLQVGAQPIPKGRHFVVSGSSVPTPETTIINIFDNVYFVKNAINRSGNSVSTGDLIASVPNSKGSTALESSSSETPRTEIMKYVSTLGGLINLDNENIFSLLNPENVSITAPCEVHFTGVLTSQFPYEAYINVYGMYLGELGGSLRTTQGSDPDNLYTPASFEVGKPFYVRMVYGTDKRVTVYINNVALGGSKATYFSISDNGSFLTRIGVGTDTNNAKWYASSICQVNRLLTTSEVSNAYNAFKTLYSTEAPIPNPYYKYVNIDHSTDSVTATGTYYSWTASLENTALRKYRWYKAGNNPGAPDVTNNTRVTELDDVRSWAKADFSTLLENDIWFRVDIDCTDMAGRSFTSGCIYVKVN